MKNIVRIEKSWKFEGYCFIITEANGSERSWKRKIYDRKTGKNAGRKFVNLDTNVYSFIWEGNTATDIKWVGTYKTMADALAADEATEAFEKDNEPVAEVVELQDGEIRHTKYNTIKACISNDVPVFLVGPAGSGKNHTLEQIAKSLELDFYFTNSIQQEFKLTGFIDAGGTYHETEFYKAFVNGGLFFLDEMDASIPEVLVLLNAAIANKYFEFPNGKVTAHESFRVVAAGNTVGDGADEQYVGRLTLDQATLDRFVVIEFDYDINVEMALAKNNTDLVNFIRDLRKQAKERGIRCTFSYRAIISVSKLENHLPLEEVILIAVFKGLDPDTVRTFTPSTSSKYYTAMKAVQAKA